MKRVELSTDGYDYRIYYNSDGVAYRGTKFVGGGSPYAADKGYWQSIDSKEEIARLAKRIDAWGAVFS